MHHLANTLLDKLKWLQRRHPFINLVIIPIREFVERHGYSPKAGWFAAQLVSWEIKTCLAIPAWLTNHDRFAWTIFCYFTLIGMVAACAPWLGYKPESIFVIKQRRAARDSQRKTEGEVQ